MAFTGPLRNYTTPLGQGTWNDMVHIDPYLNETAAFLGVNG